MPDVEKISLAVTPEMAMMMREVVAAGEYTSASEVMREALQDWKRRRAERRQAMDELGRHWDVGIASGPATEGEEAFDRIKARLAARLGEFEPK